MDPDPARDRPTGCSLGLLYTGFACLFLGAHVGVGGNQDVGQRFLAREMGDPDTAGNHQRHIVKGDARCLSIAAASIIAKVTRDRIMIELGAELPQYGFERHKGYGTPEHGEALARHGVSAYHRRSFKPVQLALGLV